MIFIETMKTLGKEVREHRRLAKLSQLNLADMAGCSRTAIQRIEDGHPAVQMDTLFKVLNTLNLKLYVESPLKKEG